MNSLKLKLLLPTVLILLTVASNAAAQDDNFVGYRHKGVIYGESLPNGVKDLGGGLLGDEDYGVTRFSKNGKIMLWLEKIVSRDQKGVPGWQVKDVLNVGKRERNQEFLFSYSSTCRQNNRINLDLIVLAELVPKAKNYKLIRAWRANTRREKFEKVSLKNIQCAVAAAA